MGNYRFRLSDMMPNAWFYKLKDMSSKAKSHGNTGKKQHSPAASTKQPHHHHFYPRKSYYFTRQLVPSDDGFYVSHTSSTKSPASRNLLLDPAPRRSSRKRPGKRNIGSSVPAACRFHAKAESPMRYSASSASSDDEDDRSSSLQELRSDCILSTTQSSEVRDVKTLDKLDGFDNLFELQLPRIITKPVKFNHSEMDTRKKTSPGKKFGPNSPGVRLRLNSPKIGSRRIQGHARKSVSSSSSSSSRKSLSDSFAVVKSSMDPQRDFRESMVEMIMENNIRASKDLEDLLACYLSLNSDEYHHLIIKVFKQIWFDMNDIRLK